MLTFIGLGLGSEGISLEGLREAKEANRVYMERYTSLIPSFDIKKMEDLIENSIRILKREDIEQNSDEILQEAEKSKVALLVIGDPMVATTHVDLRLRAKKKDIETKVVHAASIQCAAPGLCGLQSYKFGRTATIPLPEKPSESPYEVLEENRKHGLHTLFLLDIEFEEDRYLTADSAIKYLFDLEEKLNREIFAEDTLCVVVARVGESDSLVRAGLAQDLKDFDFGPPPHVLIVPGNLHFLEAEALEVFGGASKEDIDRNAER